MSYKPHILHIISGLSTGGAERMLVKFISTTKDRYYHEVVSLTNIGQQGLLLKEQGIPVHAIEMSANLLAPFLIFRVSRLIRKINPDLIHGWMYHGNVIASLATRFSPLNSIPLFHSIRHSLHDMKHEKWTTSGVIRLNSFISKSVEKIIFNSYVSKEQHIKIGYKSDNATVIPNGFDTDLYQSNEKLRHEIRKQLDIPSDSFVFLQVGRNHPTKNHPMFLKAAYNLLQKSSFPSKPVFFLIGSGIPGDHDLQSIAGKVANHGVVKLLDEQENLVPFYCSADALTLTSWGEAFPNVLGEAMSCGLPCITTDVGDAATIVGNSGMVVHPDDCVAFSESMLKIASMDDSERIHLGKMARKRVMDSYSIDRISERYMMLYKELLSQPQFNS